MGYLPYQSISTGAGFLNHHQYHLDHHPHYVPIHPIIKSPPHPIETTKASIERPGMATMGFFTNFALGAKMVVE